MHSIGEKVVYSSMGVATIVDIRQEKIGENLREYYVLRALGAPESSLTFVPADNKKLVSEMRPLLSREEIMEILKNAEKLPEPEWSDDNRIRNERFKSIIDSGDRAMMIAMLRAIYKRGEERLDLGKKNYLTDENAMKRAEKILYSEFSAVLGIPENNIPEFIKSAVCK